MDAELLLVWVKSHRDGSAHTVRVYARVGERFVAALGDGGLPRATVETVQTALEAMRIRSDGQPVSRVKSLSENPPNGSDLNDAEGRKIRSDQASRLHTTPDRQGGWIGRLVVNTREGRGIEVSR
jgi:hypothetical protein